MDRVRIIHLVLDILKPHQPPLPEFAAYIREFPGVSRVDASLIEMDEKTESLKVVIDGGGINFDELKQTVIAQSIAAKKAPKARKKEEEKDSYLKSFF